MYEMKPQIMEENSHCNILDWFFRISNGDSKQTQALNSATPLQKISSNVKSSSDLRGQGAINFNSVELKTKQNFIARFEYKNI